MPFTRSRHVDRGHDQPAQGRLCVALGPVALAVHHTSTLRVSRAPFTSARSSFQFRHTPSAGAEAVSLLICTKAPGSSAVALGLPF